MAQKFSSGVRNSYSDNRKSKTCPAFDKLRPRACRGEPSRRIQNLKWAGLLAIVVAFAMCGAVAQAQQQAKVAKIGWLGIGSASSVSRYEEFRRILRELGYVEGKNIAFEFRSADNKLDRLPALADELVRLKVDVIVKIGRAHV